MQIPSHVKIDYELFVELVYYHLLDNRSPSLDKDIQKRLNAKIDAMTRHEIYTESKTAEDPVIREKARQKYLDHVGMRESFRWSNKKGE